MKFKIVMIALSLSLPGTVAAGTLQPIKVRAPVDQSVVNKKCQEAFAQAKQDRLAKEAQENFSCFAILSADNAQAVENGFMLLCREQLNGRAEITSAGANVELGQEELITAFNCQYAPLITTECATRENKRISDYNNSHGGGSILRGTAGSFGGQGLREGCFATNSCY